MLHRDSHLRVSQFTSKLVRRRCQYLFRTLSHWPTKRCEVWPSQRHHPPPRTFVVKRTELGSLILDAMGPPMTRHNCSLELAHGLRRTLTMDGSPTVRHMPRPLAKLVRLKYPFPAGINRQYWRSRSAHGLTFTLLHGRFSSTQPHDWIL